MRILPIVLSAVSMSLPPTVVAAQKHAQAVETSFNQFRSTWRDAWNRGDTKTLASLMAEDIDWIAADGTWLKGRKAWQEHHERLFAQQFKTAKWKLLDERVQPIDSRTVITISATEIGGDTNADGTARDPRRSVATRIITKSAGKWLLKVAHNTIIQGVDMK